MALKGRKQPVEGPATGGKPVRAFTAESLKTFLVPLDGATECQASKRNVGCGSFQAKWKLPKGGSRLGQDIFPLREAALALNIAGECSDRAAAATQPAARAGSRRRPAPG